MAIDTPLGFSDQFVSLITRQDHMEPDDASGRNNYLFRQTERHLLDRGQRPLSAVMDRLGSQATKGMHVLAKFAPQIESCGVWTDGHRLRAIEAYPSACRESPVIAELLNGMSSLGHDDKDDARVCALIAYLFAIRRDELEEPSETVSFNEGWIWIPQRKE
jgi:hypothetical protein